MNVKHEAEAQQPAILTEFTEYLKKIERRNFEKKVFYKSEEIKRWMKSCDQSGDTNVAKLLRAVQPQLSKTREHEIADSIIVFAILLDTRLNCGHLISTFKKIRDTELARLDRSNLDLRIRRHLQEYSGGRNIFGNRSLQDLIEIFNKVRWHFCPLPIHMDMDETFTGEAILPFCDRNEINAKGGTANVHHFVLQEDFVSQALANALGGACKEVKSFGKCYDIAIKSYRSNETKTFHLERDAFRALHSETGVIKYLGEYTVDLGSDSLAHSILLEYGEHDLDEYLAANFPPVLYREVLSFWTGLFDVGKTLKRLHKIEHDGEEYAGWHGDIKPDNILRVRGEFKLADFGFAQFKPAKARENQTYLPGTTRTWGAPEIENTIHQGQHSQKIDTWSFGCVLSSVATWVILGQQAYDQYPEVRRAAIQRLRKKEGEVNVPTADDCFHDGQEVLPVVRQWHDLLRNSIRKSDTISERVLDLVESHLLVGDVSRRITIPDMCRKLDEATILSNNAHDHAKELDLSSERALRRLDPSLLKTMLHLDEDAPATPLPAHEAKSVRWTVPEPRSKPSSAYTSAREETVRVRKSERLDKNVRAKVAFREEVIKHELGQESDKNRVFLEVPTELGTSANNSSPADTVVDKGKQAAIPTIPTIEEPKDVHDVRPELRSTFPFNDVSTDEKVLPISTRPAQPDSSLPERANSVMSNYIPQLQDPKPSTYGHAQVYSQYPHLTSGLTYNQPLDGARAGQFPLSPPHSGSLSPSQTWMSSSESAYAIFQLYENLRRKYDSWMSKTPKDPQLEKFIYNRDIKFVVDNSVTMYSHWHKATKVLLALAMKIGPLDKDGLDLVYTIGQHYQLNNVKKKAILPEFEGSMNNVGSSITRTDRTNMKETLQTIFDDYLRDSRKRMTLIVLTDGLWQGSTSNDDVENLIADFIKKLQKKLQRLESRWFSIQFVSFGEDRQALGRLQDLDDKMKEKFGIEDIIDTKPWYHDPPEELILGSIKEGVDVTEASHPTSPVTPIGPGLSSPLLPNNYGSIKLPRPSSTYSNPGSTHSQKSSRLFQMFSKGEK